MAVYSKYVQSLARLVVEKAQSALDPQGANLSERLFDPDALDYSPKELALYAWATIRKARVLFLGCKSFFGHYSLIFISGRRLFVTRKPFTAA